MILVIGASVAVANASEDVWSPYYRISAYQPDLERASTDPADGRPPYFLSVDGIPHQQIWDSTKAAQSDLHRQAYAWFPDRVFDRVLIIGAGSGTDTALALAKGAKHVDAVEIDPKLAQIGRDFHPEGVYKDPRVTVHVNDGRAFLNGSKEKYDLIVYALTDSLTLVSSTAGVRLESFLFTEESMREAKDHLAPGGMFTMYNLYREPWLITKLDSMLGDVFGGTDWSGWSGPPRRSSPRVRRSTRWPAGRRRATGSTPSPTSAPPPQPATDDWPFLYLRTGTVAPYYLAALAFILIFAFAAVVRCGARHVARRSAGSARTSSCWASRSSCSRPRASCRSACCSGRPGWSTRWRSSRSWPASCWRSWSTSGSGHGTRRPSMSACSSAIAIACLVPADALLIDPPELRYVLAAAIAFAPVFFANLVFTYSFRDTDSADMSFASNLLGAMVGGVLEYVALVTGFQSLLILVAGLYVVAFLLARRFRFLADVQLADTRAEPSGRNSVSPAAWAESAD